jgi:hypothetical protein
VLRCARRWLASAITAKGRQADVDSRRRGTSVAGAVCLAFEPGHAFGELIEVGAQGVDRGITRSLSPSRGPGAGWSLSPTRSRRNCAGTWSGS